MTSNLKKKTAEPEQINTAWENENALGTQNDIKEHK